VAAPSSFCIALFRSRRTPKRISESKCHGMRTLQHPSFLSFMAPDRSAAQPKPYVSIRELSRLTPLPLLKSRKAGKGLAIYLA